MADTQKIVPLKFMGIRLLICFCAFHYFSFSVFSVFYVFAIS